MAIRQAFLNRKILLWITTLLLLYSCKESPENCSQTLNNNFDTSLEKIEIYINLQELLGKRNTDDVLTVEVKYDHFFKTSKRYKGYFINPILDSIVRSVNFDTTDAVVVFKCWDGYAPEMDFSKVIGNVKGYFAFKDLDPHNRRNWPDSVYDKFMPYYLVWDDVKKNDNTYAWPFGLVELRITSKEAKYKSIYPFENTSLVKGFALFRDNCMKCHSINKVGGSMGPEFNLPKNITEYWKQEDIISFAKNPGSYRYNSHMPAITNIKDSDFKQLILYIKSMRNKKLNN